MATELARWISPAKDRRVVVGTWANGFFGFTEDFLSWEDAEYTDVPYWAPCGWSGLYASAEEAKLAAINETPWLRALQNLRD